MKAKIEISVSYLSSGEKSRRYHQLHISPLPRGEIGATINPKMNFTSAIVEEVEALSQPHIYLHLTLVEDTAPPPTPHLTSPLPSGEVDAAGGG